MPLRFRNLAAFGCLLSVIAAADAVAQPLSFCAGYNGGQKQLTLRIDNGCVTGSYKYLDHDLSVDVDEHSAAIISGGGFRYAPYEGRIVTGDCGGGRREEFVFRGVEPRRYSLIHDGEFVGVVDFTASHDQTCLRGKGPLTAVGFRHGWKRVVGGKAGDGGPPAERLIDLVMPFMAGHPESDEGRPTANFSFASGRNGEITFKLTMTGYLDDSVAGERFEGTARLEAEGWRLVELWSQTLCGRGGSAGQWVAGLCS